MRGVNPLAFFSCGVKPKNGFSMIKIGVQGVQEIQDQNEQNDEINMSQHAENVQNENRSLSSSK